MSDEEQVYRVEKILRKRSRRGKVEYFVHWEGYASNEDSWVLEEDILDPELIATFEAREKEERKQRAAAAAAAAGAGGGAGAGSVTTPSSTAGAGGAGGSSVHRGRSAPSTPGDAASTAAGTPRSGKRAATLNSGSDAAASSAADVTIKQEKSEEQRERRPRHSTSGADTVMEPAATVRLVVNARRHDDALFFLVEWSTGERTFLPNAELRTLAPQKLIDFYEQRLRFQPKSSADGGASVGAGTAVNGPSADQHTGGAHGEGGAPAGGSEDGMDL